MLKFLKRTKDTPEPGAPSAASSRRVDANALLARVQWTSARYLNGLLQGNYRTLFRGSGIMFTDIRAYEASDDVRHIDWNVTARMQTPYVRQYEEDRELTAWFLLDLSASIDFGSEQKRKREVAAEAIATLGHLLRRHGNRVGLLIDRGAPHLDILPARNSQKHLLSLLRQVLTAPIQTNSARTDLSVLLRRANRIIRQRSTIFVISDFYATPGWQKPLTGLASRHDVVALRLVDPIEHTLPDMGMLIMRDSETGEQVFIDSGDDQFRKRFARASQMHLASLMTTFSQAGVDCLELSTHETTEAALIRFIHTREQLLRRSSRGKSRA